MNGGGGGGGGFGGMLKTSLSGTVVEFASLDPSDSNGFSLGGGRASPPNGSNVEAGAGGGGGGGTNVSGAGSVGGGVGLVASSGGTGGETGSVGVEEFFHFLGGVLSVSSLGKGGNMPPPGATGVGVVTGAAGSGTGFAGAGGGGMTGFGAVSVVSTLRPVMRSCRGLPLMNLISEIFFPDSFHSVHIPFSKSLSNL